MRLKMFSAPTMAMAMDLVRQEMGDNAIIVSTQPGSNGRGARVTAALDDPRIDDTNIAIWDEESEATQSPSEEIREALAYHRVPDAVAERLVQIALPFETEGALMALAAALDAVFNFAPLSEKTPPRPLMLIGAPGAGKTIVAAKLATRARRSGGKLAVITTDTRRAGGVDQLQAFTRILGVELFTAETPADLAGIVGKVRGALTIIDTAGTNPFSDVDMENLKELVRSAQAEPAIVMAAGGEPAEAAEMATSFGSLGARRLIATRLDISRRLGSLMAAVDAARLSFSEVSISTHVADGVTPINPVSLARLLLPHGTEIPVNSHMKEAAR
jgi:flagellar biosynthesis protein FlhF